MPISDNIHCSICFFHTFRHICIVIYILQILLIIIVNIQIFRSNIHNLENVAKIFF